MGSASHLTPDQRAALDERAASLSPEQRAALRESGQGLSSDRATGRGATGTYRSISRHPTPSRAGLSGGVRLQAARGGGRGGRGGRGRYGTLRPARDDVRELGVKIGPIAQDWSLGQSTNALIMARVALEIVLVNPAAGIYTAGATMGGIRPASSRKRSMSGDKARPERARRRAPSRWRAARTVRVRSGPVLRDGRCALRASPPVRQRRRSGGGGPAGALRGRRPLRPGCPLAAVAAHRADLRAREPQARLLPLHGVPDRALAGQQHPEPAPRSARRAGRRRQGPRLARPARAGARRRPRATAASAASRRASSTPWPRCSSRPWATGCATSTASSGRRSRTAGSTSSRTTGCGGRTRGRSPGRRRRWRSSSAARSRCAAAALGVVAGRPSTLLGIPFDRPVVGYGGKTINTLRLWAAAAPDVFDFQAFSAGEFVERAGRAAHGRVPDPRALSRRFDEHGAGAALRAGVLPRRLLAGRPRAPLPPAATPTGARCPTRSPSSSTTPTRAWPCPS